MRSVNIHQAKTQLSRLVDEAAKGRPFIIARAGKPLVQVLPLDPAEDTAKRRIGFMPDIEVPDDFDTMMSKARRC